MNCKPFRAREPTTLISSGVSTYSRDLYFVRHLLEYSMLEHKVCPICNSRFTIMRTSPLTLIIPMQSYDDARHNDFYSNVLEHKPDFINIAHCNECSHLFITPTYSLEECRRIYSGDHPTVVPHIEDYLRQTGSDFFTEQRTLYGSDTEMQVRTQQSCQDRPARIKEYVSTFTPKDYIAKVADVGGGDGNNIRLFTPGNLYVMDYNKSACTLSGIKQITHDDVAKYITFFDLVVSTHTLEHMPIPQVEVGRAASLCREGGYFYCEVPLQYLSVLKQCWKHKLKLKTLQLRLDYHIQFYTRCSLATLFSMLGFRVVDMSLSYESYNYIRMPIIRALFQKTACTYKFRKSKFFWEFIRDGAFVVRNR